MNIRINSDNIQQFADIIRALVERGLTFEVTERGGFFIIELTGGF